MALSWDWIDKSPTHNLIAKGRRERRVLVGKAKSKTILLWFENPWLKMPYREPSRMECILRRLFFTSLRRMILRGCYEPFKMMSLCGISYLTSNSSRHPPGHFFLYAKTPSFAFFNLLSAVVKRTAVRFAHYGDRGCGLDLLTRWIAWAITLRPLYTPSYYLLQGVNCSGLMLA